MAQGIYQPRGPIAVRNAPVAYLVDYDGSRLIGLVP